jgi:hypothetical protein
VGRGRGRPKNLARIIFSPLSLSLSLSLRESPSRIYRHNLANLIGVFSPLLDERLTDGLTGKKVVRSFGKSAIAVAALCRWRACYACSS